MCRIALHAVAGCRQLHLPEAGKIGSVAAMTIIETGS
jgi:hypothetical protein